MRNSITRRLDTWIFESFTVTGEGLGIFRIFVALFTLFFLIPGQGAGHYFYLASLPSDFFSPPPGPMMLLDTFPPFLLFQVLYTLLVISLIALLVGYRTRLVSVTAGVLILILQGLIFSIGKVNHVILVPLVPLIMAFSNWGVCFSIDSRRKASKKEVHSWPLTLLALFIAFMMFTAGFPKILGGWLDPSTQAVRGHILNQFFVKDRDALLAPFAIQAHSPVLWEVLDWCTILFETGFLIAVWRSRWFKIFLILAVFFHFSTQLLMNISFLTNFLAYSAFLSWTKIYQKVVSVAQYLSSGWKIQSSKVAVFGFGSVVALFFSILKWLSVKDIFLPDTDLMLHESILLFTAVVIVICISLRYLFTRRVFSEELP